MVYKWCSFSAYQSLRIQLAMLKGEAVSNAVVKSVQEWGLKDGLMPCALIPLQPILADEVELVV